MNKAWLRAFAAGLLLMTGAPAVQNIAQDNPKAAEESAAPKSAKEVRTAIQNAGKDLGRNPTTEQIDAFFVKAWKIAADYVIGNPEATDLAEVYQWAGPRAQYGKNNPDFLRLAEQYLKANAEAKDAAEWKKYYLAGSLGDETRKKDAEKEVAAIEKAGADDATKALLAAEIRLIDCSNRADEAGKTKVIEGIKANKAIVESKDVWVYRDAMRIVFANSPATIKVGEMFPDWGGVFEARDIDGKAISMADFKGKVVLIDFWATWCGPCINAMPDVVKAYEKYGDAGFVVIGISLDRRDAEDRIRETIKGEGKIGARTGVMPWRQVFDGGYWNTGLSKRYGISSIPRTVLIDKEGRVIADNPKGADLHDKLAELLGDAAK